MPWLLIWIVLVLCALAVLALLAWRLWGRAKALTTELGRAMARLDQLSAAMDSLAAGQGPAPGSQTGVRSVVKPTSAR